MPRAARRATSQVPCREDFLRGRTVTSTADAAGRDQLAYGVPELSIERADPRRELIHQDDRARMRRKRLRRTHLIVPGKTALRVGREVDVVRRIRIDEVVRLKCQDPEIAGRELPRGEGVTVRVEASRVVDLLVLPEWRVELAVAIEPAEPVVRRPVHVVEEFRGFAPFVTSGS